MARSSYTYTATKGIRYNTHTTVQYITMRTVVRTVEYPRSLERNSLYLFTTLRGASEPSFSYYMGKMACVKKDGKMREKRKSFFLFLFSAAVVIETRKKEERGLSGEQPQLPGVGW